MPNRVQDILPIAKLSPSIPYPLMFDQMVKPRQSGSFQLNVSTQQGWTKETAMMPQSR